MSALHVADCTTVFFPADLASVFSSNLWRKWLIGLEFVAEFLQNAKNGYPPCAERTDGASRSADGPPVQN